MAVKIIIAKEVSVNDPYYIYAHTRLDTNEIFYIGIGTNNKKAGSFARAKSKKRNRLWFNITSKTDYSITIFDSSKDMKFIQNKEINYISILGKIIDNSGELSNIKDGGEQHHNINCSDNYRKELSIKMKGNKYYLNNNLSKIVYKLDLNNNIIISYNSARLAAIEEKISHTSIIRACNKGSKCKNYYWKYGDK